MADNKIVCKDCGGQGQVDPAPLMKLPDGTPRMIVFTTRPPNLHLNISKG